MKKLELNQMEQIEGEGCGASMAFAFAGVAALAIFGGPFGWGTVAAIFINGTSLAYSCGNATEF
tara:strand:+ start:366 stop:557 length:192 start_codon:yes stop_codon:yes gene_type:complete